jgi:transposase InsO family protein
MDVRLLAAVSGELDGLNVAALCREHDISRKTFYKWRARYAAGGLEALEPRSRRPLRSPTRVPDHVEDAIVEARKWLLGCGLDAGAANVSWRLRDSAVSPVPSEATIWRVLTRRGFVSPEPRKRPRRSWKRFEAAWPNECWQIDATHWALRWGRPVEIVDIIDDHSRLLVASVAVEVATSELAWEAFSLGVVRWGLPARCLSDNGLVFSGRLRHVEVYFESKLHAAGVRPVTSRPFHPQTCGKVERFHQTLKKWLRAQRPRPGSLGELQAQIDAFAKVYNHHRPHRGIGRATPYARWSANLPAGPAGPVPTPPARRLHVTVDRIGIAHAGKRWLIGVGAEYRGQPAEIIIKDLTADVIIAGRLVRHLQLDPDRAYQPSGRRPGVKRKDGS